MTRSAGPMAAAVVAMTALASCGNSPAPKTLVTLGASDVVGVGATHPAEDGWAPALVRRLPGSYRLVKVGVSG